MRLSMSTQTNLVCLSLLTESLPSLVGWDYSAGGAGDGAGKNLFCKSRRSELAVSFSTAFSTLHEFILYECQTSCWHMALRSLSNWNPTVFMPNSKVQIQSCKIEFVSSYRWSPFFCSQLWHSSHLLSCVVVCIDKWRQWINVKRHVNHHPLTLQLHPGAVGHHSRLLFSAPTAGLPAGAAGLTDREVTTRGQPHVIFSHTHPKRGIGAFIQGGGSLY